MTKQDKIIAVVCVVAGVAGYFVYKYAYSKPNIVSIAVNWTDGYANFTVDGQIVLLQKGLSVLLKDPKWSISFITDVNNKGRVVLLKNGLVNSVLFQEA